MAKGGSAVPDITQWLDSMPFVKATFRIPGDSLASGRQEDIEYIWGFSVSTKR